MTRACLTCGSSNLHVTALTALCGDCGTLRPLGDYLNPIERKLKAAAAYVGLVVVLGLALGLVRAEVL